MKNISMFILTLVVVGVVIATPIRATGNWNDINSVNTSALLLMLPLIATLISVLHYVIGLSGYGIFMPTMIAVAFLATGVANGLALFGVVLSISLLSNYVLKRFKLHFWPSRAINLMFISLGTFGLMKIMTYVSIFPMMFMILLSEEFVRTQLAKSKSEAKKLMIGTLVLATAGALIMGVKEVQDFVLKYPWWCMMAGLIVNIIVGNYSGIRFSEIKRFKKAIRKK